MTLKHSYYFWCDYLIHAINGAQNNGDDMACIAWAFDNIAQSKNQTLVWRIRCAKRVRRAIMHNKVHENPYARKVWFDYIGKKEPANEVINTKILYKENLYEY